MFPKLIVTFVAMMLNYRNSNIHYTIQGQGKTVVLLHGFLENTIMWQPFLSELTRHNQVICVDLLGHGNSDCIGYTHTMEDMADAVYEVLKFEKISEIQCIGHSMGGYVALALAEKHPELFRSLSLLNSTFEADDNDRKALRQRAKATAKTNFEQLVRISFTNLFAEKSREIFKHEIETALQHALQTPVQGYIAAQEGMILRPNRFKVFNNLKAKKALVISLKDWVVNAGLLKEKSKNTDVDIVEFSEGHMSHIENKEELSYFFKRFIEK